jgi:glycine hydroxymethyltransferase
MKRTPIISSLVDAFNGLFFEGINLVASENISSPAVRAALASDLHHRYVIPRGADPAIWDYPNQDIPRKILIATHEAACRVFGAAQASAGPHSGNMIAAIMLNGLLKKRDVFLSVGSDCGGHFTTDRIAQDRGYRRIDLPYNRREGIIDVDATATLAKRKKAKLIFLDASMIAFPYPVRELREALGDDVVVSYDASHTLGIIAGGKFQDPLAEGADFLHGSAHKSLWGPQKGLILSAKTATESENARAVFSSIIPLFVSNAHPHHIAALGIALEESEMHGKHFARDTIANARILGRELTRLGLNVAFGDKNFTDCHQIMVKIGTKPKAQEAFRRLENVGLRVNAIRVPYVQPEEFGLRIGASEITRRGMNGNATVFIAKLIADVVLQKRDLREIRKDVASLSHSFRNVNYTLNGREALRFENVSRPVAPRAERPRARLG